MCCVVDVLFICYVYMVSSRCVGVLCGVCVCCFFVGGRACFVFLAGAVVVCACFCLLILL